MPEPLERSEDKSPHSSLWGSAINHQLILFYSSIIAYKIIKISFELVIEKSIPMPWIPLEFQFHSKELEWNWNSGHWNWNVIGIEGN
jgi:hypothetical protein